MRSIATSVRGVEGAGALAASSPPSVRAAAAKAKFIITATIKSLQRERILNLRACNLSDLKP
jgi:hypothetical protein